MKRGVLAVLVALASGAGCSREIDTLRVGYAPNLSHAAAVVGIAGGRLARVNGIPVRASVYNAGSAEVQALMFGDLDIAYLGPVPALAAHARSKGRYVIVSGAAEGGAALVASKASGARVPADLRDKRVATPQAGNTQDVAARCYFGQLGFTSYEHGGQFHVAAAANADLMSMFAANEMDAAWTVEPWVTQLVEEGGARLLLDEAQLWAAQTSTGTYPTAVVMVRASLIKRRPDLVEGFLRQHAETTVWIRNNPDEAQKIAEEAIGRLTRRSFKPGVMAGAWSRVNFTTDISRAALEKNADDAARVGFLGAEPIDFDKLINRAPLERATGALPPS